jgi:hypothetical protein
MDDAGNTKDDLKLPLEDELASAIKAGFEEGKELVVTVLKARYPRPSALLHPPAHATHPHAVDGGGDDQRW